MSVAYRCNGTNSQKAAIKVCCGVVNYKQSCQKCANCTHSGRFYRASAYLRAILI